MATLVIISLILAVLYVGTTIWVKKELPESISAMVYDLSEPWRWIWTIWIWTETLLVAPALISVLEGNTWQFVGFLASASLLFTGGIPLVKDSRNTLHYIFGILSGVLLQVCVILICPMCLFIWVLWAGFLTLANTKWGKSWVKYIDYKGVFLVEITCYVSFMCALILAIMF